MRKYLKPTLIAAGIFSLLFLLAFYILKVRTESYSPEETVTYKNADLEIEVFYNRPYKKERLIFGGLVPYNEVWRTGANEATTFETNQDILVDGSPLPAGIYTFWTIPMEESWKIIFNSEMYAWGITLEKKASRIADYDVLILEVPVTKLDHEVEQFTIAFEEINNLIEMQLIWDNTAVIVPIKKIE